MVPRSKAEKEEKTIVSIELVAETLRKEIENLDLYIKNLREQITQREEGEDGRTQ